MKHVKITDIAQGKPVQMRPGLVRTTLSSNEQTMLCHFRMKAGTVLELHNHEAVQNGYVISGRLAYQLADANHTVTQEGEIGPGGGYVWDSMEVHSTRALEDTEFIEFFTPPRPEYMP